MFFFKVLLALPALTAVAMPVAEKEVDAANPDFPKRWDVITPGFPKRNADQPDFPKRWDIIAPEFPKRDTDETRFPKRETDETPFPKRDTDETRFPKRETDETPFPKRTADKPDFPKRDTDETRFPKRETDQSPFPKRNDQPDVIKPEFWKRFAPNHRVSLSMEQQQIWQRATAIEQPDLPEFIDTSACICGLLTVEDSLPHNGEIIEMWRCTASVDDDISKGTHGKWFNTTLPSQELSGYGAGRQWFENPPYLNDTYVLVSEDGGEYYEALDAANAGALQGGDVNCTGMKDQTASAAFYASQS